MYSFVAKILDIFLLINQKILEKKYRVKLDTNTTCNVGSTNGCD